MHVEPLTCLRPTPERVTEFAALPYDVFTDDEARAYVREHPTSFLAIDRPETGFPEGQDPHAPEVYEYARQLLRERQLDRTLVPDEKPCFYIYELRDNDHVQRGVMGAIAVDDYLDGTVRQHERTLASKEQDRVDHITALRAQTGPVFLAYEESLAITTILDAACTGEPLYDFTSANGVGQRVWRVSRPVAVEAISVAFTTVAHAYIADGHHRAAAAARICEQRRAEGRKDDPAEAFLGVLFPSNQLKVLPYERIVADTAGLSEDELVARIREAGFACSNASAEPVTPAKKGTFGMYAFGAWRQLSALDADEELDVAVLQERLLSPVLGIDNPRTDERISFAGNVKTSDLERLAGKTGVAFSLYPTSMAELMEVADKGEVMPPKSTWFEPKLLSGLALRRIW